MSAQFGKSVTEVSYLVGIYVLVLGAGPLIWNPFAQTLGRRPVVSFPKHKCLCKKWRSLTDRLA